MGKEKNGIDKEEKGLDDYGIIYISGMIDEGISED